MDLPYDGAQISKLTRFNFLFRLRKFIRFSIFPCCSYADVASQKYSKFSEKVNALDYNKHLNPEL
jgi:hypothetical protein